MLKNAIPSILIGMTFCLQAYYHIAVCRHCFGSFETAVNERAPCPLKEIFYETKLESELGVGSDNRYHKRL